MDLTDQLQIDTPEQIALELPLAGIGSRFLALAIDTVIQFLIYFFGIIVFGLVTLGAFVFEWAPKSIGMAFYVILIFCVYWGYFALFEIFLKGQTPGKKYAGIRVIKDTGRPINAFEAVTRNLMRAVDSLPGFYGVGLATMMLNKQSRRLGDLVAGTIVVHEKLTKEVKPSWTAATGTEQTGMPIELTQVTTDDLILIETYLQRRWDLEAIVRNNTAIQIANRIETKTGLKPDVGQHVDDFLETVARQVRDSGRLR
jgi:uncharacterized RDD family membrane protein YckC